MIGWECPTNPREAPGLDLETVHAGDDLLDKHLSVHPVSPGGFDWGPDAAPERVCQLAIALLAPTLGLEVAVNDYHLFAENFIRRELTGDEWSVRLQDLREASYREQYMDRDYLENTAPAPADVDIETIDLDTTTYAEELVLVRRYDEVLWKKGNTRGNLVRLQAIRRGERDPAAEPSSTQWLSTHGRLTSSAPKRALGEEFETMGEFAAWACYATSLTTVDHVGDSTATMIRGLRPTLVRWFGGAEYIPQLDDDQETLVAEDTDEDDGSEDAAAGDPSTTAAGDTRSRR
jgi:hypothetical protein